MSQATFSSTTHSGSNGAQIEVGTVGFEGRPFQAIGSVVDPSAGRIDGYISSDGRSPATWGGEIIVSVRQTGTWLQRGFGGIKNRIYAWTAVVDGVVYSGRNSGPAMRVTMRAGRGVK